MSSIWRRLFYVLCFEACGIGLASLLLMLLSGHAADRTSPLALACSLIAVGWNFLYNTGFERWEARQPGQGRSAAKRVAHVLGLEAGLVLFLTPLIAWWLSVDLWTALGYDLATTAMFLAYAFVFNLIFDAIFGLPASARRQS
ncbi:PACE efflux transporter [Thioclava sp. BHET1]|nr:PACE efflux transporter [Thioclava sp. BHET1]